MGKLAQILTYDETHISQKIAYIKEAFKNIAIDNIADDGELVRVIDAINKL